MCIGSSVLVQFAISSLVFFKDLLPFLTTFFGVEFLLALILIRYCLESKIGLMGYSVGLGRVEQ